MFIFATFDECELSSRGLDTVSGGPGEVIGSSPKLPNRLFMMPLMSMRMLQLASSSVSRSRYLFRRRRQSTDADETLEFDLGSGKKKRFLLLFNSFVVGSMLVFT